MKKKDDFITWNDNIFPFVKKYLKAKKNKKRCDGYYQYILILENQEQFREVKIKKPTVVLIFKKENIYQLGFADPKHSTLELIKDKQFNSVEQEYLKQKKHIKQIIGPIVADTPDAEIWKQIINSCAAFELWKSPRDYRIHFNKKIITFEGGGQKEIPLRGLIRNQFMLSITVQVLRRIFNTRDSIQEPIKLTEVDLMDNYVEQRFERQVQMLKYDEEFLTNPADFFTAMKGNIDVDKIKDLAQTRSPGDRHAGDRELLKRGYLLFCIEFACILSRLQTTEICFPSTDLKKTDKSIVELFAPKKNTDIGRCRANNFLEIKKGARNSTYYSFINSSWINYFIQRNIYNLKGDDCYQLDLINLTEEKYRDLILEERIKAIEEEGDSPYPALIRLNQRIFIHGLSAAGKWCIHELKAELFSELNSKFSDEACEPGSSYPVLKIEDIPINIYQAIAASKTHFPPKVLTHPVESKIQDPMLKFQENLKLLDKHYIFSIKRCPDILEVNCKSSEIKITTENLQQFIELFQSVLAAKNIKKYEITEEFKPIEAKLTIKADSNTLDAIVVILEKISGITIAPSQVQGTLFGKSKSQFPPDPQSETNQCLIS